MDDQELVTNLNRVAKNIETALNRLKESQEPMNASAAQLPLAKQYLADLKRMTEEGAHVVMDVTEALQEAQRRMSEALTNVNGERSTQALHDIFMEKRNAIYSDLYGVVFSRPRGSAYRETLQHPG